MAARVPPSSDNAWQLLLADDFRRGNLLLSGWTLGPYTGWTTEVPIYALAIAVLGLGPWLFTWMPALIYAALAAVAAGLAATGLPGPERRRAVLVAVLLFATLPRVFAWFMLQTSIHVGTALFGLAATLLFARSARGGRWAAAGSGLLTFLACAADPLALTTAVALLVAGAAHGLRRRRWRVLLPPGAAVAAGALAALALRRGVHRLGGYATFPFPTPVPAPAALVRELSPALSAGLQLLGSDGPPEGALAALAAAAVGLAAAAALVAALARWLRPPAPAPAAEVLDLALVATIAAGLAFFIGTGLAQTGPSSRYLEPAVASALVLVARAAGGVLARRGRAWAWAPVASVVAVRAAAMLLVAAGPPAPDPHAGLAAALEEQGLRRGYATYWDASVVSVESGGRVQVRNVIRVGDRVVAHHYVSKAAWYEPGPEGAGATFLVLPPPGVEAYGVGAETAGATFGEPVARLRLAGFEVLVFGHDLAPQLAAGG